MSRLPPPSGVPLPAHPYPSQESHSYLRPETSERDGTSESQVVTIASAYRSGP